MNEMPDDVERAELDSIGKTSPKDGPLRGEAGVCATCKGEGGFWGAMDNWVRCCPVKKLGIAPTPRPWKVRGGSDIYGGGYFVGGTESLSGEVNATDHANAALIVEAVNSHDALKARVDDLSAAIINCVDSGTVDGQGAAYLKRLATEAKEALRGK